MKKIQKTQDMIIVFLTFFTTGNCLSIGSVGIISDKNVTNRNTSDDKFPDWVPFKNKHGEELGEFIPVPKIKPKKRLALPANFIMEANVGTGDYADGQNDSEDYYEKEERDGDEIRANITDIEHILKLLSKPTPSPIPVMGVSYNNPYSDTKDIKDDQKEYVSSEEEQKIKYDEAKTFTRKEDYDEEGGRKLDENETEAHVKKEHVARKNNKKKVNQILEEQPRNDETTETTTTTEQDDDAVTENDKTTVKEQNEKDEKEKKENEARKKVILSGVDDLKRRHELEQRLLTESLRDEELTLEERERDMKRVEDGYSRINAYKKNFKLFGNLDKKEASEMKDKYWPSVRSSGRYGKTKKTTKSLSDTTDEVTTIRATTKRRRNQIISKPSRYSSKYTTYSPKSNELDEDINKSFVPGDKASKNDYLPYGSRKKNTKVITSTISPDSFGAESIVEKDNPVKVKINETVTSKDLTQYTSRPTGPSGPSAYETAFTDTLSVSTTYPNMSAPSTISSSGTSASYEVTPVSDAFKSAPSAASALTSESDSAHSAAAILTAVAVDAVAAPSHHEKEPAEHDHKHEKGGDREHHSEHFSSHEEHGKKAYEGVHEDSKTKKGHHDKEDHEGNYHDHGGIDKHHHDEKDHYGIHHHEEHGKKHAKYEESGKHSKGHSTKGSHDIHKKEEYEKKVEFFEEEGDSAEHEKHGGHNEEKEHSTGGKFHKGKLDAAHDEHKKGEIGHFDKGAHGHTNKGHKLSAGHDSHGKHGGAHFKKAGSDAGKKWVYHHGQPARTAHLAIIDRRQDNYLHGPQYYG